MSEYSEGRLVVYCGQLQFPPGAYEKAWHMRASDTALAPGCVLFFHMSISKNGWKGEGSTATEDGSVFRQIHLFTVRKKKTCRHALLMPRPVPHVTRQLGGVEGAHRHLPDGVSIAAECSLLKGGIRHHRSRQGGSKCTRWLPGLSTVP